jgi:hypothetical protein
MGEPETRSADVEISELVDHQVVATDVEGEIRGRDSRRHFRPAGVALTEAERCCGVAGCLIELERRPDRNGLDHRQRLHRHRLVLARRMRGRSTAVGRDSCVLSGVGRRFGTGVHRH